MFPRSSEIKPLFRGSVRYFFLYYFIFFFFFFLFLFFIFFFHFVYRGTVGPPWTCVRFLFFFHFVYTGTVGPPWTWAFSIFFFSPLFYRGTVGPPRTCVRFYFIFPLSPIEEPWVLLRLVCAFFSPPPPLCLWRNRGSSLDLHVFSSSSRSRCRGTVGPPLTCVCFFFDLFAPLTHPLFLWP